MKFEPTEENITLHGLGFVQVKLAGNQRMHVWHPELPRRSCFEHSAIHDHRFSFTSRVLVGQQINVRYTATRQVSDLSTHMAYLHEGKRTKRGNRPWKPDFTLAVHQQAADVIEAGQEYRFMAYCYHSTQPGGDGKVATIMKKTDEGTRGAHSLCALGVDPDVDFDRKQWAPEALWAIVTDVLGSVK